MDPNIYRQDSELWNGVAYGYIRQIMVIHGGDDCTITVMTMMTTTMLFLMRNMEKSSN